MEIEQRKRARIGGEVRRGTIEGVIFVDGWPQVERADMPFALSFKSVEELERFCEMVRKSGREQH